MKTKYKIITTTEMGKRKSRAKVVPKKKVLKTPKVFQCPFCNHEGSVEFTVDREYNIGTVRCRVCHAQFQAEMKGLTEAIDVYSDWIDQCELEKRRAAGEMPDDQLELVPHAKRTKAEAFS